MMELADVRGTTVERELEIESEMSPKLRSGDDILKYNTKSTGIHGNIHVLYCNVHLEVQ